MRKRVVLAVFGLVPAAALAAMVGGISDDFSGDLSQWKTLAVSTPSNATVTYAVDTGRLKALGITSNTASYASTLLLTNDSVTSADNVICMSSRLSVPTTAGTPKSYQGLIMTVNNTGATFEYLRRNAFEFQFTQDFANMTLTCYNTNETPYVQTRLASSSQSSLGWSMLAGHDYAVTLRLDKNVNQLALNITSLDGTAIVNGQATASTTLTYSASVYEPAAYYGGYYLNAKSTSGTQTETYYGDTFRMVPEPAALTLLLLGGVLVLRRRA